jgi:hypothetical protein
MAKMLNTGNNGTRAYWFSKIDAPLAPNNGVEWFCILFEHLFQDPVVMMHVENMDVHASSSIMGVLQLVDDCSCATRVGGHQHA